MNINGIELKHDKDFGNYFGTTVPEAYDVGKNHFKPLFRSIFVSPEMYPNTEKSFFYVTSDIVGYMRNYRCRYWYNTRIANIFASGKTLEEAVNTFEYNLKNLIYNVH